ncbi:MAG: hypothetical protein E7624_03235 [Ruminococcaceae bacterium]|nr:hypothetical protein [Oscillospiraceae bacterium]
MSSNHIFSRVGHAIASATGRVYHAIGAGPLGRLFTSYQKADCYFHQTALVRSMHGKRGKLGYRTMRRRVACAMDQSLLRRAAYGTINGLCRCSMRTLGAFFLTLGVYTAMITWLIASVWQHAAPDGTRLFFALAMILPGILLLFSDRSVAFMLTKGRLIGILLHTSLGLSDDEIKNIPEKGKSMYTVAISLGMLLGVLTAVWGPLYPLCALLVCIFLMLTLTTPEAGILLLLVFAPFLESVPYSALWLALGVFLSFAGYVFKLMRGTRAFRMEIQDFAVLLLLLLTLLSGVSAAGGSAMLGAFLCALLMMVYFPAVNILSTPLWLKRCRWGLLFSAAVVALIGVLQFAVALLVAVQGTGDVHMIDLGTKVHAGFASNVTFAYFMVLVFPFSLHAFIRAKNSPHRLTAGFICMAVLAATVLTWLPGAWMAILFEIVVLFLLCKRSFFPYFVLGLVAVPVALFFLPAHYRAALFAFLRNGVELSGAGLAMKIFFGEDGGVMRLLFGVGADGAERIGVMYTGGSVSAVSESLNFWWEQWLESGVLGMLLPAVLFFFLLQNCFSLLPHTPKEQSAVAPVSGIAMVTGAITISFFTSCWQDPVALLLFFILISIVTADARVRRSNRGEEEEIEQSDACAEFEYRLKEKHRKKAAKRKEVDHEQQNG